MADEADDKWLFGGTEQGDAEWGSRRRFISEEFNPIYRQGVIGPFHLCEADFADFLTKTKSNTYLAAAQLSAWADKKRPQGGDFSDLAFNRIDARALEFDSQTAEGIIRLFAEVMDDIYKSHPKERMFFDVWQQSESILNRLEQRIPPQHLNEIVEDISQNSSAISWMTGAIGRAELWAHGLAGDRVRAEERNIISLEAISIMLERLADRAVALPNERLLDLPRFGSFMYALKESPWTERQFDDLLHRLVFNADNELFIGFLEAMHGVVISSGRGVYHTLSKASLLKLVGDEPFEKRWEALNRETLSESLARRLETIRTMMSEAKNW